MNCHKNEHKKDGIVAKARNAGLDLSDSKIESYVCDTMF